MGKVWVFISQARSNADEFSLLQKCFCKLKLLLSKKKCVLGGAFKDSGRSLSSRPVRSRTVTETLS